MAVLLLSDAIGPKSWKLGGRYAASYIGGGVNYTAVGEAVNASDTLFATGAAADTIMTTVWMVAPALIPALFVRFYDSIYDRGGVAEGISAEEEGGFSKAFWQKEEVSLYDLAYLAAVLGGMVFSTLIGRGPVFLFLVILVVIRALVVFGIGRLRKIETLCVASQATVGGPSTALALAISKRWSALVAPSVLLGILGYATGNYLGVGMGYLIRSFTG